MVLRQHLELNWQTIFLSWIFYKIIEILFLFVNLIIYLFLRCIVLGHLKEINLNKIAPMRALRCRMARLKEPLFFICFILFCYSSFCGNNHVNVLSTVWLEIISIISILFRFSLKLKIKLWLNNYKVINKWHQFQNIVISKVIKSHDDFQFLFMYMYIQMYVGIFFQKSIS